MPDAHSPSSPKLPDDAAREMEQLRQENRVLKAKLDLVAEPSLLCEDSLAMSERLYRVLAESGEDVLLVMGKGFKTVFVSPAVEWVFGYTPDEFRTIPLRRLMPRETLSRIAELKPVMRPIRPGMARISQDLRFIRKNGEEFWAAVTVSPMPSQEKGEIDLRIVIRDITARIQSEAELKKLTTAVDQSPASIVITDTSGTIEYVNPSFLRVTGYTREEAIGQNPRVLKSGRHPDSYFAELWKTISSGKVWRGMLCNRKKNGALYWESASISPVFDEAGNITNYIGVKEDITKQVDAEQALQRAHRELEAIFENSLVGVLLVREDRRIIRVNTRLTEMFGYSSAELMGRTTRILHVTDELFDSFGKAFYNTLAKQDLMHLEHEFRRKDGQVFWCQVSGRALSKKDLGKGVIWVLDDISERKKVEAMKEDIDRISRHDLKGPLNAVINLPQLVLTGDNLSPEQRKHLKSIQEAGYRMLNLVNLTLDLYRMETGSYTVAEDHIDGLALWRKVVSEHRRPAMDKGVQVDLRIQGQIPEPSATIPIQGEQLLLHSMLSNLYANAVEASPDKGVIRVDMDWESGGEVGAGKEWLVMAITNQGEVPPDIRDRLFDKYVTQGKKAGTGLGTYSARLIARTHQGDMSLDCSTQGSTTIRVRLPA